MKKKYLSQLSIKTINFLIFLPVYMNERNDLLLAFIKGVMGDDFRKTENAVLISNAVDNIYYLTNSKFVGPLVFATCLLIYSKIFSNNSYFLFSFYFSFQLKIIILNLLFDIILVFFLYFVLIVIF